MFYRLDVFEKQVFVNFIAIYNKSKLAKKIDFFSKKEGFCIHLQSIRGI
jgi:hypothetical protein